MEATVTPLLVAWVVNPRLRWNRERVVEYALLILLLVLVIAAVFGEWSSASVNGYLFPYLCLPFLVWTAFRFSQREVATTSLVLAVIAIWGTLHGHGLFAEVVLEKDLLQCQGFMAFNSVIFLAVTGVTFGLVSLVAPREIKGRLKSLSATAGTGGQLVGPQKAWQETVIKLASPVAKAALAGIAAIRPFWEGDPRRAVAAASEASRTWSSASRRRSKATPTSRAASATCWTTSMRCASATARASAMAPSACRARPYRNPPS